MKMPLELESECEIINYSALSQEQRVYVNPSLPWFTQNVYCTCWYPNEPLEFWHVRTCVDGSPWWDIFSRHHLLWICCSRFVDTIYTYITSLYGKICKYDRSKTRWNNVADKQKPAHHAIISKSLWGERERESSSFSNGFFAQYIPLLETFQNMIGMQINSRTSQNFWRLTKQQS